MQQPFSNFLRSFFIIMNVNFEVFVIIHHMCFYISIMKPEAATGGIL